ncbi:hypothetical protein GCM10027614_10370 [Micromonospora vulcania]
MFRGGGAGAGGVGAGVVVDGDVRASVRDSGREKGIAVAIVNQGPTRGDGYATLSVDAPLGVVLPALADRLTGADAATIGAPTPV